MRHTSRPGHRPGSEPEYAKAGQRHVGREVEKLTRGGTEAEGGRAIGGRKERGMAERTKGGQDFIPK